MAVENRVVDIAARQHFRHRVTDEFGNAQHPLRRLAAFVM
jgi:hypothetical protein